jgi:hypothetical protein
VVELLFTGDSTDISSGGVRLKVLLEGSFGGVHVREF